MPPALPSCRCPQHDDSPPASTSVTKRPKCYRRCIRMSRIRESQPEVRHQRRPIATSSREPMPERPTSRPWGFSRSHTPPPVAVWGRSADQPAIDRRLPPHRGAGAGWRRRVSDRTPPASGRFDADSPTWPCSSAAPERPSAARDRVEREFGRSEGRVEWEMAPGSVPSPPQVRVLSGTVPASVLPRPPGVH